MRHRRGLRRGAWLHLDPGAQRAGRVLSVERLRDRKRARGDREIQAIDWSETGGSITLRIRDALLDDPVALDTNDRGPIITVADFFGRRLVSYQLADVGFSCAGVPLESSGVVQRGGSMPIDGTPWLLSGANVN